MNIVALIPARANSRRVPGKNLKLLGGKPLIQWTIEAAKASGVFRSISICTDDERAADLARDALVPLVWRPPSTDDEPDYNWVRDALYIMEPRPDAFAILRPTSPFRTADTIRRASQLFRDCADAADSLRAVQPVKEHPYKMWRLLPDTADTVMRPLHEGTHPDGTPWHSSPTQSLPPIYVQNSSLELSWTSNIEVHGTISGRKVVPFVTDGMEGFAIDYPEDWETAERYAQTLLARV